MTKPHCTDPKPWEWLGASVTRDGTGYRLSSPAGLVVELTSEEREFMAAAANACDGIPTEELRPKMYTTVASESLSLLRRFYAAGGRSAFPESTELTPAIQCSMKGVSTFGTRIEPDHSWNVEQAKYILEREGYTVTEPKK